MPRKLLNYVTGLFSRSSAPALPEPRIIPREHHSVSRKQISRGALDVLYGLHKGGFQAFLVGGCLRDILTGGQPKDFDVVTNATPEEVRGLFRRSRIIGRRFRLVHVMVGREVIEVSTFRALATDDEHADHSRDDGGLILRDNVYGSIEEDALRRDFTINALYYNIADFSLYDFMGSLGDLEKRQIRLIGNPEQRYREDPVRMLRAARFAAKLGFDLAPETEAPIHELGDLIYQVSSARLFDEVLKLFLSGYALASLEALQRYGLFGIMFPEARTRLDDQDGAVWQRLIERACHNTDMRLAEDKPVTPAFLYAVILWPALKARMERHLQHGMAPAQALARAAGQVLNEQCKVTGIPKRFSTVMREIWEMQPRLDHRSARRAEQLVAHPRFRAAYDFLLLREQAGELEPGLGEWWTQYQIANDDERQQLVEGVAPNRSGSGRKRRRRRPRRGGGARGD